MKFEGAENTQARRGSVRSMRRSTVQIPLRGTTARMYMPAESIGRGNASLTARCSSASFTWKED